MKESRVGSIVTTCLALFAALALAPPGVAQPTDLEIIDAFFSSNPAVDCRPYVTSVSVTSGTTVLLQTKGSYGAASFPTDGSDFLVLASGDPDAPGEFGDLDVTPVGVCGGDNVQITFAFNFPDDGGGVSAVQSMGFNFDFFSYEYPEFIGAGVNDYVLAYLDYAPVALDAGCNAPVPSPAGCLITFDGSGNPTNVDNAFFQGCDVIGCDNPSGVPGWDTVNSGTPGDDAGRTGTLTTCTPTDCTAPPPLAPGVHTLTLIVGDAGDGIFTSAGLFDNLQCFGDLECEAPVTSFCGDNIQDPGEDCDGTDDAACPGECDANCQCPAEPVGACCSDTDATCSVMTQAACDAGNDLYVGDGTDCTDVECPLIDCACGDDLAPCDAECGACCTNGPGTESECVIMTREECETYHHLFLGDGTECTGDLDCVALAVTIESIGAEATRDGVRIHWSTATEIDTVGFQVLRQTFYGREKAIVAISPVIPVAGNGLNGASYEFVDRSKPSGSAVNYFLEDIDIYGKVTRHGPVQVQRGRRTRDTPPERVRQEAKR